MSQDLFPDLEKLLRSISRLLASAGQALEVRVLSDSVLTIEESSFDNWNGGTTGYTLVLTVPVIVCAQISEKCQDLEESIKTHATHFFKQFPNEFLDSVQIVPALEEGNETWREKAKAWAAGQGVSNQGRVNSSNIATREKDGLLFRSEPEINLYLALKSLGVTFAPLPVFIRGGKEYSRIEPDFIIIKDGIVLHVEVDGDRFHHENPEEAHRRTTILLHEGVKVERVKADDCATLDKAYQCANRLLGVIEKHKASR